MLVTTKPAWARPGDLISLYTGTGCKHNQEFRSRCVKWFHVLLPVMVGYDGSQSSHTYSVAHQMDFLAQNVFKPARRKQQDDPPSPRCAPLILRGKSKVLLSIWQQPDYRGEEHKQADTGEGQSYPGEDGKEEHRNTTAGARTVIGASHDPGFFTLQVK